MEDKLLDKLVLFTKEIKERQSNCAKSTRELVDEGKDASVFMATYIAYQEVLNAIDNIIAKT